MKLASTLLAFTLGASSAAPSDNPLDLHDQAALGHFTAGMDAWLAEDYATAQRELEAAYEIEPRPPLLYSLGQLARLRGDCETARVRFEAFLATGPSADAARDTRVNLERCEPQEETVPPPTEAPAERLTEEPVAEATGSEPTEDPTGAPTADEGGRPDPLGVSLTVVGGALTAAGAGLFGASFAEHRRAEDEFGVSGFERHLGRARTEYWTGVGLATAGVGLLVGGIVRLVLVRRARSRRDSGRAAFGPRHFPGSRYSW
jgi:hypothetical protein